MAESPGRARTPSGAALSVRLADGRLELQCCTACGATQYPPAELCRRCLGDTLVFTPLDAHGTVIASALVHRSLADDFAIGGPWPIASVRLDAGPIVFAHLAAALPANERVQLVALRDRLGDGVLGAVRNAAQRAALLARFEETT